MNSLKEDYNHEPSELLEWLRQLVTIRCLEERLLALFSEGLLFGTTHTSIGQEACAVGVVAALDKTKDNVFSNHRGHGHYVAFTDDVDGLIAELMGRKTGVCKGVGGSQHLCTGSFFTNGIQGSILPVAAGTALGSKLDGDDAFTCVFIGDGTLGEGAVYEALNIASIWSLPLMIVVENNGYAQSTDTTTTTAGDITDRAAAFSIPAQRIDGNNLLDVVAAASAAAEQIRANSSPQLLCLDTYRLAAHSKSDDLRPPEEIDAAWEQEPIRRFADTVGLAASAIETAEAEAATRIDQAVDRARAEAALSTDDWQQLTHNE